MQYLRANIEKPIEFLSCGQFYSDVPWTHSKRSVDSFEIIIGIEKCLYISQGEEKYEVRSGDVLVLLPGVTHEGYRPCEEGVSFFWFHFLVSDTYGILDEEGLDKELAALKEPDSPKRCSDVYLPVFYAPAGIERANILFQQLQHIGMSNYYTRQAAHYIATLLLIELSDQMIGDYQNSPGKPQGDRNIAEIIEWVRIHALTDISASDVAEHFTYNRNYLSRFFKQKTGFNLQEYINLMKISKAKEMLTRGTRSIRDIAEGVGIHDEKYFMRLFKKYESMTPTEYRKAFYRIHLNNH
ncbi:AraC family transcriptional regulator [Paenibacillus darwinianus]|uniref:AraC family transcriptional regulator n=1 Tax=Paenibacillus darwinianus TaxID=1380763 RepID=A0A9W5S3G4_9BACL|nr:AraC family transcriptional regulator [Paenibacillus darwinianus]EXX87752.1 AraC family transcriptional regulator [Paenibacillus darwinianus]EXX91433.1 AraC family transcriptional regulator [Paenibacillus darwinianus]EXX92241.1 AraC family transcriptional regulator [Paenibacillus darwinianus]